MGFHRYSNIFSPERKTCPYDHKTCQNTRSVAQLNFAVLRSNVELRHDKVKWTNDYTWNY